MFHNPTINEAIDEVPVLRAEDFYNEVIKRFKARKSGTRICVNRNVVGNLVQGTKPRFADRAENKTKANSGQSPRCSATGPRTQNLLKADADLTTAQKVPI